MIIVHEYDIENLNHLQTNQQLHGYELIEKEIKGEERVPSCFIDIVFTIEEDILGFVLVFNYVLIIEKGTDSCQNND